MRQPPGWLFYGRCVMRRAGWPKTASGQKISTAVLRLGDDGPQSCSASIQVLANSHSAKHPAPFTHATLKPTDETPLTVADSPHALDAELEALVA
jgi:hypothetical protein